MSDPSPSRLTRVLIVEDDRKVSRALQEGFAREACEAVVEDSGEGAFFRLDGERFDAVILDLGLPGRDGMQVLKRMRGQGITTPVLILTARDALDERVRGLDSGADDYLIKPFAFAEVLARTRALVRRGPAIGPLRFSACGLDIDSSSRRVTAAGQPVDLTLTEFDLLEHLARHEGQIVSRESLVRVVWKDTSRSLTLDNVIDVHMARLRRKLGDLGTRAIQTVRGVGFVLRAEPGR